MTARIKPTTATTVKGYFEALSEKDRADLTVLRQLIQKTVPKAVEDIEYKMPTYRLNGELLVALAAQKQYLCLYLCNPELVQEHAKALAHLNIGKGCIRFKTLDELPLPTIKKMLRQAAKQ